MKWYDSVSPVLLQRYTQGQCDVFARALWIAHGKPYYGCFLIMKEKPNSRYCHMYYYDKRHKKVVDILGVQTIKTAKRRWNFTYHEFFDPEMAWEARQEYRGDRCGGHVTQALRIIEQDPQRYILT